MPGAIAPQDVLRVDTGILSRMMWLNLRIWVTSHHEKPLQNRGGGMELNRILSYIESGQDVKWGLSKWRNAIATNI
jgi:hypothetical protein